MLFRSNDTATTEIYTLSLHDALPILVDKYEMRIDEMESEQLALRREAHAKQTELENQIAELEKQSGNDPEATFKLICGMLRNPLSQLMVFAGQNRDYILETKKFLNGYLNALEDKK